MGESYVCPHSQSLDFGKPSYTKPYDAKEGFVKFELPKGDAFKFKGRKCRLDDMYCQYWSDREVVELCPTFRENVQRNSDVKNSPMVAETL